MAEADWKCPRCGAPLAAEDRFCGYCGERIPAEAPPAPSPPPRPVPVSPEPVGVAVAPSAGDEAGRQHTAPEPVQKQEVRAAPPPEQRREDEASVPAPTVPRPGFWDRSEGWGLTILRLALGGLLLFPGSPLIFGGGWGWGVPPEYEPDPTDPFDIGGIFGVIPENLELLDVMALVQGVLGAVIILGVLFRPVCFLVAATFVAVWWVFYDYGTSFAAWGSYLAFAVVFLGLMVAGPGRLALRRKRKATPDTD